jgi:thymidylate kinase
MIPSREIFLTTFFASLERNGVRYCVMRNYDNLYGDASTDVDMLLSPYSLERFERCLREAADQAGFQFVHSARYVNYSHVFWHPRAGFIRIDFETQLRWRLFTLLNARELLDRRRRYQEFFIPHPEDESAILFLAALWRGQLSERYRRQLAALHLACQDADGLRRTLKRAFGEAGGALADFQAQAITEPFDQAVVKRVRRSLLFLTPRHWWRLTALLRNTGSDFIRLRSRLRRPAGISLLFVSAHERPQNFQDLIQRINFLFPVEKCSIRTFDLTAQATPRARWSLRLRGLRFRTLFKGGLFLRAYRVARDADVAPVLRAHAHYVYPSRTFVCGEDKAGRLYFAHVRTGFMTTSPPGPAASDKDFSHSFIKFILDILERDTDVGWGRPGPETRVLPLRLHRPSRNEGEAGVEHQHEKEDNLIPAVSCPSQVRKGRRGMFCALVGLDGSGKTTLARNLCDLTAAGCRFNGVRYFHWRPKVFRHVELPLPEFQNLPRKTPQARNFWSLLLSAIRLLKNAALVNLACRVHVRPLLARGYLVLVDRYFYNYHLDPVSVKYTGPAWLLTRAEKWFPGPDAVITLSASADVLLRRKQELTQAEILEQGAVLQRLKFSSSQIIRADAAEPPEIVAEKIMAELIRTQS